jgi:dynein heavy chain 1, cytosolic
MLFLYIQGQIFNNVSFELEVAFEGDKSSAIVFIKKQPELPLTADSPAKQLHFVNLGNGSPFETLHSYVHNTFVPYFRSFLKSGSKDKEGQSKRKWKKITR